MMIGLGLAPVAVNMALGKSDDGSLQLVDGNVSIWIAIASLPTTVFISIFTKGLSKLLPVFGGIAVGYLLSLFFDIASFDPIHNAAWFTVPTSQYQNLTSMPFFLCCPLPLRLR
jgi:uracil permease